MRATTKLMRIRTILDPTVPRITNLYNTVKQIIDLDAEKVTLHPSDRRRVQHALRYFVDDVDKTALFLRSRL